MPNWEPLWRSCSRWSGRKIGLLSSCRKLGSWTRIKYWAGMSTARGRKRCPPRGPRTESGTPSPPDRLASRAKHKYSSNSQRQGRKSPMSTKARVKLSTLTTPPSKTLAASTSAKNWHPTNLPRNKAQSSANLLFCWLMRRYKTARS